MDSEPFQQLSIPELPVIDYELLPMSETIIKIRRHCNVYPCTTQSTHYLVTNFGGIAKLICGVCDAHAHALDEYLAPLKLHKN